MRIKKKKTNSNLLFWCQSTGKELKGKKLIWGKEEMVLAKNRSQPETHKKFLPRDVTSCNQSWRPKKKRDHCGIFAILRINPNKLAKRPFFFGRENWLQDVTSFLLPRLFDPIGTWALSQKCPAPLGEGPS